ncbi:Aminopeptidase M1-A [Zea mays]|uniref:Aminopeptidase M1-A n=1 Tax=Zea mays TaxID=4577 RepID=A0A3L6F7L2_MAIZE|nr:Aminopeptidase M1-A [Zea mays]
MATRKPRDAANKVQVNKSDYDNVKVFLYLKVNRKAIWDLRSNRQVAVVVAHELTHQWFGNFVTMKWWTHLWLNEGFATWVSYLAADHFFPEWNVWTQFLEESTIGFKLDALAGSHPIEELHTKYYHASNARIWFYGDDNLTLALCIYGSVLAPGSLANEESGFYYANVVSSETLIC